ncbi:MAG: deoxynucleoside kinase [Turicibacter sp.]
MQNKQPFFIAVEGPIGVGKTSLATILSNHYQFDLLKEIVYENPFLDKFYDDIDAWAFQTEMFFLTNRYKQLTDIHSNFLAHNQSIVADYHLFKNLIFSRMTLNATQYEKYEKIYHILEEDLPQPNVIIVLNASLETITKRIKMRNRHFEQNIDPEYLQTLIHSYHDCTKYLRVKHQNLPIIEINGDEVDFIKHPEQLHDIISHIDTIIRKGV